MIGFDLFIAFDYQLAPQVKFLIEPKLGLEAFIDIVLMRQCLEYLQSSPDTLNIKDLRSRLEQPPFNFRKKSFDDPELHRFFTGTFYQLRDLKQLIETKAGFGCGCHIKFRL
jgi:hypothetical protein